MGMTFSIMDVGNELLERAADEPTKLATKRIPSDNAATLTGESGEAITLDSGETADIPQETHRLDADRDTIAVLTLVHRSRLQS